MPAQGGEPRSGKAIRACSNSPKLSGNLSKDLIGLEFTTQSVKMKFLKLPEGAEYSFLLKLIETGYFNSLDVFESPTSK